MRTIVCWDCTKKYNLKDLYLLADLFVIGGQGDESNCGLCGKPSGGADIDVPQDIVEIARSSSNKNVTLSDEDSTIFQETEDTPESLLARKLSGDPSVTDKDIHDATVRYFNDNGINCKCNIYSSKNM